MSPERRVPARVDAVRRHLRGRAWRAALLWSGVLLAAVLLAAWLFAGGEGWGQGTAGPLVLDALLLGLLAIGALGVRRLLGRWLSDERVSGTMEEATGMPSGAVLGSLELARSVPPGVSPSLAARAAAGVGDGLRLPEERLAGRMGEAAGLWARRARTGLALLLPVLVLVLVLTPERSASAWKGLGTPFGLLAGPVLPPLAVHPGDAEVSRGEAVEVRIDAPGRDSVTLRWRTRGDVERATTLAVSAPGASHTFSEVRAAVEYWAEAPDGARTERFALTPVDPLFVGDVSVEVRFPQHTGRPVEEYRGDVPPLTLPVGTTLEIEGSANRPLAVAALEDSAGARPLTLDVDGSAFSGRWTPRRDGSYAWIFRDVRGGAGEVVPLPLELTLVPDAPPAVRLTAPGRDTVLPMGLRLPLAIEARDDYGVETLELVAYRVTSLGDREEPRTQSLGLGGSRALLARPVLDVSGWGLLPGDTVRYYARVVDNGPAAQEARTREYVLRMPGTAELRRAAEERLEETAQRMEELGEEAARSQQETQALERQAAAAREREESTPFQERSGEPEESGLGFEEREDVRRALDEQARMEEEVDSLRRSLDEMSRSMEEAGLADPGLRESLDELQELMEEISSEEDRERLQEMMEQLQEMDADEAQQSLEELQAEQEEFREQIERSLERFKRAAVEQDFRATTSEAEELARQEEALADAFREEDDPEGRAEQQDELQSRAETMEERMERLEQRLQELGEQDAAREVRDARQRSGESRQSMQAAGQQARQQQGQQAGEQADQAAEALQEAVQQLQQAQSQMASEQAAAMEQALRQAASDALSLARRQSELRERMQGAGTEEMGELRGDVAALAQGAERMAENVASAQGGAGSPGGGQELSVRMGQALEALNRTVQSMERQGGPTPSPQSAAEAAVQALNGVALMAMAGAQQMAQGAQGQQQAQGQQDVQEQLQSLAQQQGQLNNETGQMMPMQLGQQAMQQQMEQLSQGQQSVASNLGDLSDRPGAQDQALGDLEALAEEARALARELAGGRLDPEVRERQERLFHRLLDAGRSLEKEEFSEERESENPGVFERGEVLPLGADALNALRFRLPPAEVLQRLNPAQRRLVVEYFERLNEAGGGDGGQAGGGGGGR